MPNFNVKIEYTIPSHGGPIPKEWSGKVKATNGQIAFTRMREKHVPSYGTVKKWEAKIVRDPQPASPAIFAIDVAFERELKRLANDKAERLSVAKKFRSSTAEAEEAIRWLDGSANLICAAKVASAILGSRGSFRDEAHIENVLSFLMQRGLSDEKISSLYGSDMQARFERQAYAHLATTLANLYKAHLNKNPGIDLSVSWGHGRIDDVGVGKK